VSIPFPETRHSLILRLADASDVAAWEQFAASYEPVIYRLARYRGFQDADAADLVQEVLVARAVERWQSDRERGRFRDWLYTIAKNFMLKALTRRKHRPLESGDSGVAEWLANQTDPTADETAAFDGEYERAVFGWAAERVRGQVRDKTWLAFCRTSIEGCSIPATAAELEMTPGSVHIARCSVLGRLRKMVREYALEEERETAARRG